MQLVTLGQAFHSEKLGAVRLHGKHNAGTYRLTAHENRASAAYSVLAAQMGAGEIQLLAQKVRQRHSDLHQAFIGPSIDRDFDHLLCAQRVLVSFTLANADSNARRTNTPPTSLR